MLKKEGNFSKLRSLSSLAFAAKFLGGLLIGCVIAFNSLIQARNNSAAGAKNQEVQEKKLSILPLMLVGGIHIFRKGMEKK